MLRSTFATLVAASVPIATPIGAGGVSPPAGWCGVPFRRCGSPASRSNWMACER